MRKRECHCEPRCRPVCECEVGFDRDRCLTVRQHHAAFASKSNQVLEARVGDTITVVIQGDGTNGAFTGTLVDVSDCFIRVVLTQPTSSLPAGSVVTVLIDEIAAVARTPQVIAL